MNICFVTTEKPDNISGGVEHVTYQLARELTSRGHTVICCCLYSDSTHEKSVRNVFSFPDSNNIYCDDNISFLHNLLIDYKIDIIINNSQFLAQHDVIAAARNNTKAKLIYTLHSDPDDSKKSIRDHRDIRLAPKISIKGICCYLKYLFFIPKFYLSYHLQLKHKYNKLYGGSDMCVLLSSGAANRLLKYVHATNRDKITVIPNFSYIPNSGNDTIARKKQIVFVGRLHWQKRVDRLLKIWGKIAPCYPDWKLIIVGDGPYKQLFENIASYHDIKNVLFVGKRASQPYFRESMITCVTSSHEGFPLVLIEAMKCGCIPVAYDSFSSIHDIINHGENGFAIAPYKTQNFINCLKKLMSNDELRNRISLNAIQSEKRFDKSIIVNKWEDLFNKLLNK